MAADRHRASPPTTDARASVRRTYGLGGFLLLLMALQAIGQHSYGALAPFIREDLGSSGSQMGLIGSALYLGTASAAFLFGGWVDRRPPRTVVLITGLGVAASLVVIAIAPVVALVMLGYLLVGLSRGAIPPLTDRVGYESAPIGARGLVFGLKATGTPVGSIAAALVLPPIAVTVLGWRGAMIVAAAFIAVVVLASGRVLDLVTAPEPDDADHAAASQADDGATPADTGAPDHGGRDPAPEPSPGGLREMVRRLSSTVVFSFGLGIFQATTMTFLTLFLVDAVDLDAVSAARWFALFGVGGAIGRIVCGWLSDRVFLGRRSLLLLLSALLGGGLAVALGLAPDLARALPGGLSMAVFGFAVQGWVGVSRALGTELAGPGYSGRAGGLLLGSMMVGGLIGPPVFGWLADITGGYGTGWVVFGALAVITGTSMLPAMRRERHARRLA